MLKKSIKLCKKLVDMPYNKLNLDNYLSVLRKMFNTPMLFHRPKSPDSPIRLMSGKHNYAGILEAGKTPAKIILIGKGVLFDAGGYDLKRGMNDMKNDMAGMATVLAVMNETKKVRAICPVATNLITNNLIIPR